MRFIELFVLLITICCASVFPNVSGQQCKKGRVFTPHISGGERALKGEWRWVVAFVHWKSGNYFCGGSLISSRHVLSGKFRKLIDMKFYCSFQCFTCSFAAAHCFQGKYNVETTPEVDVLALLGKINLGIEDEGGSKTSLVLDIIIHHDWDFNDQKYDADISIVVLLESVEFNNFIQPVCLPPQSYGDVSGTGVIVGFGTSEHSGGNHHDTLLNQLEQQAVNSTYCYPKFPELSRASSYRAFCGGFENQGKSACGGDSGGGFYFKEKSASTWAVKGIVSGGLQGDDGISCNLNAFTLYTNVARFVDWIKEKMNETKQIAWKFVDFNCRFDSRHFR